MNKRKLIKILYIVFLILYICFIFSNSLKSKESSSNDSASIHMLLNNILAGLKIPIVLSEYFVRKLAHFTEFFILGLSFFGYIRITNKISINRCIQICFASCLVAMTDETIQYFSGRGSMLLDVWLDFSSSVFAIMLLYLLYKKTTKT